MLCRVVVWVLASDSADLSRKLYGAWVRQARRQLQAAVVQMHRSTALPGCSHALHGMGWYAWDGSGWKLYFCFGGMQLVHMAKVHVAAQSSYSTRCTAAAGSR